jgi:hypothetical protein
VGFVLSAGGLTIQPLENRADEWRAFLAQSANGTLFHDLEFLRYHPPDRFRFHHLTAQKNGKLIALLPGGLSGSPERPVFCSPVGASIGGFAVRPDLRAETALELVNAVKDYAKQERWSGIEMTIPPAFYNAEAADLMSFALFRGGFRLEHRWLCHALAIQPGTGMAYDGLFRANQVLAVNMGRRDGIITTEPGLDGLEDFFRVFRDTYSRHGTAPTHSESEIRDLVTRMPDRVSTVLATLNDEAVAGLLVFQVTKDVAYTFYICTKTDSGSKNGAACAIAGLVDRLSGRGMKYIDFGPSASDTKFNKGVAFFKEGLGASGYCRDRWRWSAEP